MGSCQSTDTTIVTVNPPATAKVITSAGALREYATPVAASDALGGDKATCFICSSDRLYLDDYITALDPEELLQPRQIYFRLPVAKLRFRLSGEDMAALALKASLALGLMGEGASRRSKSARVLPVPDLQDDLAGIGDRDYKAKKCDEKVSRGRPPAVSQRRMKRIRSMRSTAASRYNRHPRTRLSTIPEFEE